MHCIVHFKVLNRFVYTAVELYFWLEKHISSKNCNMYVNLGYMVSTACEWYPVTLKASNLPL